MKKILKNKAFFYAEEDADLYDETVSMTQRDYSESHDTLTRLLSYHLSNKSTRNDETKLILDIGCGTGREALNVLNNFRNTHLVAIDLCQPMIEKFKMKLQKIYGKNNYKKYVTLIHDDIFQIENCSKLIPDSIPSKKKFDAIISAFTLHHYPLKLKIYLYSKIYNSLKKGGIFINLDLFSFQSNLLSTFSETDIENWIKSEFNKTRSGNKNSIKYSGSDFKLLEDNWLQHIREVNIPYPIHTIRNLNDSEVSALRLAGFVDNECIYRNFQTGIICSRK